MRLTAPHTQPLTSAIIEALGDSAGGGADLSGLLTGLHSWWTMDEASGNFLDSVGSEDFDTVPAGNHGHTGIIGQCRLFTGTSSISQATPSTTWSPTKDLSWSGWWKPTSLNANMALVAHWNTTSGQGQLIRINTDGSIRYQITGASGTTHVAASDTGVAVVDEWVHIAASYVHATNTLNLFVNGSLAQSTAMGEAPKDYGSQRLVIGQLGTAAAVMSYQGYADELAFWSDRALVESDSGLLYNDGAGRTYADLGGGGGGAFSPTDLAGLWSWVETGDIADFYQDNTKLTAVTAVDDPVGAWVDKSSNGNDFVQTAVSSKPPYKGTSVDMDGDLDHLYSVNTGTFGEGLFGIRFKDDDTGTSTCFSVGATATTGAAFFLVKSTATGMQVFIDGGYRFAVTSTKGNWRTAVIRVAKPGANYEVDFWFDGVKQTQYVGSGTIANSGTNRAYLGVGFGGYSPKDISGAVVAHGSYTDEEAENLSTYLTAL